MCASPALRLVACVFLLLLSATRVPAPAALAAAPPGQMLPTPTPTPTPMPGGMTLIGPGSSSGDPHLRTLDGLPYDFQAVGEFILLQSMTGDLTVQVRQEPVGTSTVASMNTALAMNVAGDRIVLDITQQPPLRINGQPTSLDAGSLPLPSGGLWAWDGTRFTIIGPDQSEVTVTPRSQYLDVVVRLTPERAGQVAGLLGNADGTADNDLVTRDGRLISLAGLAEGDVRAQLYGEFGTSWRISQAESLFDYGPGEDTLTYTRPEIPTALMTASDLPPTVQGVAETICGQAGVTAGDVLADCTLDVGLTGNAEFAASAAAVAALVGADDGVPGTYESPSYGYTITYDTSIWEVLGESSEIVDGTPEDNLVLNSVNSLISFTGFTAPEELGDAQACLNGTVAALALDQTAERRPDVAAGDADDAVAVFDGEDEWGRDQELTELTFYLRCQTLPIANTYLLTLYVVERAKFDADAGVREELLAGVDIT